MSYCRSVNQIIKLSNYARIDIRNIIIIKTEK